MYFLSLLLLLTLLLNSTVSSLSKRIYPVQDLFSFSLTFFMKLLGTQAASLHKLEAESNAAGRKLEEAVNKGGKSFLMC